MNLTDYTITTEATRIDVKAAHAFLTQSYWSPGVPIEIVERAIRNSLCFAILKNGQQVGFGRVVTDKATFAYLADVYILDEHRGRGLSKRLIEEVLKHPDLQGLRRFLLATKDAHGLYSQFGFKELANPSRMMEVHNPNAYKVP